MFLARDSQGAIISATPGTAAVCPGCKGEVVARCGSIVAWHWAHLANDCDSWSEPMSEWHRGWQERFPREQVEVVLRRDDGHHRADVVLAHGGVLELQASQISPEQIRERERFYGHMAWLFRCDWTDRMRFCGKVQCECFSCTGLVDVVTELGFVMRSRISEQQAQGYVSAHERHLGPLEIRHRGDGCRKHENGSWLVRWKHPRKSLLAVNKPMFWHVDRSIWRVRLTHDGTMVVLLQKWNEARFVQLCLQALNAA